jgi:hypothetical protein
MRVLTIITLLFLLSGSVVANDYYVNPTGNDTSGNGSAGSPWKTLKYAVSTVSANQGHTIHLSSGVFIESGPINLPAGINISGAGRDQTVIKAQSSFFYNPVNPGYSYEKYLIRLFEYNPTQGNQTLKNFKIDGDNKQLHGGIYVKFRNNVTIEGLEVTGTNFNGIWFFDVKDSKIIDTRFINCSWGSEGYSVGALNLGNVERVLIDNVYIDEDTGYGIKAIGPSGYNNVIELRILNSHVTVNPYGLWNNGQAPNIAIELWQVDLVKCEIANTYVDNTISLVNSNANPSTGVQTIRVHHNVLDMEARANGAGYGIELTIHDAEVDHNYIHKGSYAIANWDNPMENWEIHHNTFYAISGTYPGEIVRSQWSGLHNVNFYNNTIEFDSDKTTNVIGLYGGTSENINVKNNLIVDSNPTVHNYYPSSFVHLENSASLSLLTVQNNLFKDLPIGSVSGTYSDNISNIDPGVTKVGVRPSPYYVPNTSSPLIDAGLNIGQVFDGIAPDIGAYEYAGITPPNVAPTVNITSPANNASYTQGQVITITATASDSDGSIAKVEFFNGTVKLGEDLTSPYSFAWNNATVGSHSLTAIATDDKGLATTSGIISVTVAAPANVAPTVNVTSPANNANYIQGQTITITATASDSDGSIAKVEFFNGSVKLGEDLTSPYSFAWNNATVGSHSLTAKATDDKGLATTSGIISVTVAAPANVAPTVNVTSPANNANYIQGQTITITATASDSDGSIAKVEFFNGSVKLGEDLTSPYSFAWNNATVGSHSLTAKATDNSGKKTLSIPVIIMVTSISSDITLGLDAIDATLSGIMALGKDSSAFENAYFYIPEGSGKNYYIPPSAKATFTFELPKGDNYEMWIRVKSQDYYNRSFYIYDGNGKWYEWNAGINDNWEWVKVKETSTNKVVSFPFKQGKNTFEMGWLHENVLIDHIYITNDTNFDPNQASRLDQVTAIEDEFQDNINMVLYPNPATDNFTIKYSLPSSNNYAKNGIVVITDLNSRQTIKQPIVLNPGLNTMEINTSNMKGGIYIVTIKSGNINLTKRLILTK